MKIGYDAKRVVANATGLGSYGRTLVTDLSLSLPDSELLLYAPDAGREELRSMIANSPNIRMIFPRHNPTGESRSLYSKVRGAVWRTRGIVDDMKRDRIDLYHGLSGELPLGVRRAGVKSVVTIHDLIFLRHPEYYNPLDVKIYTWKFHKTIAEADRIIAISECTKRDIMYYGGVEEYRIDLVYQSCGTRFTVRATDAERQRVKTKYHLPERYVIGVGTIEERKNMLLAVKALRHLPEDISLVIVGRRTTYTEKIDRYVSDNGLGRRVTMLHGVPYEDLPPLYQMAEVAVYPSRYEGFGIPVIEAIQSGLPVVACTGSCLEEAGGPDCIYVSPDDTAGMANGIKLSLRGNSDREERVARSRQYVGRFENTDVAGRVLEIYKKLL